VAAWVLAADRWVGRLVMGLACLAMALAAVVALYQVGTRFILEQPSVWSEVLTRFLIIWSVFLGLSATIRGGALLSVDLLYRTVARTPYLRHLQAMISLATLGFLIIMLWQGISIVQRVRFQNLAGLEISISWAYAAIPVGAAFALLAVAAHFIGPRRGEIETQQ
jgi:TRAP-type C4-dicarboxylate transport system permease small subunit